ncbi:MAG: DHHA1 domain-containing protein [Candidatus Acidiferrales bacterium]
MTERLYYHDSFTKEFDAKVVSCEPDGERWKIILDRTAFYPTSGGQPHDLGTLGDIPVVEVSDEEGRIVHYTSADLPAGPVRGRIDWTRRFDHMQQHTAQHLLSAAFVELFALPTVSFHLGELICTIDLKTASLTQEQLDEAERRTNAIIFEDRLVEIRFGTAEELAAEGIRKSVDREGVLRAIRVEGFDFQPCGGTHLARTGQAGLVLLRKFEKRRDGVRVEFVAGGRALGVTRRDYATLSEAATLLTCGLPDVPGSVVKLSEERRERQSTVRKLEERLADAEASRLLADSTAAHAGGSEASTRTVSAVIEDASPAYVTLLAAKLAARGDASAPVVALLADGASGRVAFAQSKGAPHDMGGLLRVALAAFPGKGGGAKDFAQATVTNRSQCRNVLEHASRALAATP